MKAVLADLCEAIVDCEHKTAPPGDGFALSVGTRAMKEGRLVADACKPVSEPTYNAWTRRLRPVPGDLVLAREAPVGQVIRVPNDLRVCLGQRTVLLRPDDEKVVPRFLHYWLLGPDAQGMMSAQASGATVPHLNVDDIRALDTSRLPDDSGLQSFAAGTLGALDDAIENNQQRVDLLERMAQTIYREWFVNFRFAGHENATFVDSPLGSIPEGWRVVIASELITAGALEVGDGYRAKNLEMLPSGEGLSFLRVANVRDGYLDLVDCDQLPVAYANRVGGKVSQAGDSVICMKGTVGRSAFVSYEIPQLVYSPQVSYWRSLDHGQLPPEYLNLWIRSGDFLEQCAAVKGATDMADYVNLKDQRRMRVLIPPEVIAGLFVDQVRDLLRTAATLRQQRERVSAVRDLLLPKLVTGEIDVSKLDLDALVERVA